MKITNLRYLPLIALTACSQHSVTISGQVYPAVEIQQVSVHLGQRPACEFDVIAHIRVDGGYIKRDALIMGMRQQAANVGASAVEIIEVQRIGSAEYKGTARALRCSD